LICTQKDTYCHITISILLEKNTDKRNLMIESRLHDMYIGMLPPEEKSKHPSSTMKRAKNEVELLLELVS
jgi:hypothetical protein